jgi:hypothetical protein
MDGDPTFTGKNGRPPAAALNIAHDREAVEQHGGQLRINAASGCQHLLPYKHHQGLVIRFPSKKTTKVRIFNLEPRIGRGPQLLSASFPKTKSSGTLPQDKM